MKSHITPFKKNTTHIRLNVLGTDSVAGWWQVNGRPKIQKYAVVECYHCSDTADIATTAWLLEMGAITAQIVIVPHPIGVGG